MNILVLSYFPGNLAPAGTGGFDWWPADDSGRQSLAKEMADRIQDIGSFSISIVGLEVPTEIDPSNRGAITEWVDNDTIHLRELPSAD